jgi:hypothetical protein
MAMADIETEVLDQRIFLPRWLDHYESRQQRSAAVRSAGAMECAAAGD